MRTQRYQCLRLLLGMFYMSAALSQAAPTPRDETYYLFVLNEAAPGMEDEFNRWYDEQHAQDVLINPDYVSSQRYVVNERQLRPDLKAPTKYAIAFKLVTKDVATAFEYIHDNIRTGKTVPTKSIAQGAGAGGDFAYKAITDVVPGVHAAAESAGNGTSTKYLQIVFSSAAPGKEAQFNEWYNKTQAPKIAALSGVKQWQRFERSAVQLTPRRMEMVGTYLTLYEIEVRDAAALATLQDEMRKIESQGAGELGSIGTSLTYRAIGPLLLGDDVKKERAAKAK